jgi:hypothetical protein
VTYAQLALIGHMVGMDVPQRRHWYYTAETVGLTQRHAGHIIARIQDGTLYRLREASREAEEHTGELVELASVREEPDEEAGA